MIRFFKVTHIKFFIEISIYLALPLFYIIVMLEQNDKYQLFEVVSTHYQIIGDIERQKICHQVFLFLNKLKLYMIPFYIYSMHQLVNFIRIKKLIKKYQTSFNDDLRLGMILLLLFDLLSLMLFFIFYTIDIWFGVVIDFILFTVFFFILFFIFYFIHNKMTNNVFEKIRSIEKIGYIDKKFENKKSISNKQKIFYLYLIVILFITTTGFGMFKTITTIFYYKCFEMPSPLYINSYTYFLCDLNNQNEQLSCMSPYNLREYLNDYELTDIELVIENEYVIERIQNGIIEINLNYNFNNVTLKPEDLTFVENKILIHQASVPYSNQGFSYLSIELIDEHNLFYMNELSDYRLTLNEK